MQLSRGAEEQKRVQIVIAESEQRREGEGGGGGGGGAAGEEGQTRWLLGWVSETESESNIIGDSLRDSCWELGEVLR